MKRYIKSFLIMSLAWGLYVLFFLNNIYALTNDNIELLTDKIIEHKIDENSNLENNKKLKNGFYKTDNKLYYYIEDRVIHGIIKDNNQWYFVNEDGSVKSGWIFYENNWYYINQDSTLKSGWYKYYGKWYYLENENTDYPCAAICNDKRVINGVLYFFDENGALKTGWIQDSTDWYFFDKNGNGQTGWVLDCNHWYLFGNDGKMLTGWQMVSGKRYYLDETGSGRMLTGWVLYDNTWYYMQKSGQMLTGWYKYYGKWYYLNADGKMQIGWIKLNGIWYYLNKNGDMAIGWLKDNNKWYYLNSSGAMLHDTYLEAFYLNSSGEMINDSIYNSMSSRAQSYVSTTKYLILVDTKNCRVSIYQGKKGAWNNIHYYKCAPGKASTPTVKGEFTVKSRGYYFDSGNSRCFWYTQFYGNYLFHSTLYNKNGTIQDNRTGIPLSHGCVRLEIQYAKWIYDNIPKNTKVVVY